ncbi:hypothetical protein MKX03_010429, partial [Papaver bracteatum]
GAVFLYWMDSQGKESLHDHNETSEQSGEQLDSEGENEIQEEEILDLELQTGVDNPLPLAVQSQNAKLENLPMPTKGTVVTTCKDGVTKPSRGQRKIKREFGNYQQSFIVKDDNVQHIEKSCIWF